MYMDRLLEISRAENGFVVEVKVPVKAPSTDCCSPCSPGEAGKTFVCYDAADLVTKLGQILPLLAEDDPEQMMEKVFKEASDTK